MADAAASIHVTLRMAITVAAPIGRVARRAIVIADRIASATALATAGTAIAVEHTAIAAGAVGFNVAAPPAILGIPFATAAGTWSILVNRRVARLATGIAARSATSWLTAFWTNRSTANGRKHR
jgi:hypothetical protein